AAAGGLPSPAAGCKTPAARAAEIDEVRTLGVDFGVNLFVPPKGPVDEAGFAAYAKELEPEAEGYGLVLDPVPVTDDDRWGEKLALLTAHPVPVVSLTFGLPDRADIAALQPVGSRVLVGVTTPEEARLARDADAAGLVVQGPAA